MISGITGQVVVLSRAIAQTLRIRYSANPSFICHYRLKSDLIVRDISFRGYRSPIVGNTKLLMASAASAVR